MKRLFATLIGFICVSADAALIDRGSGLIYDDVLNVTWLQDANYAQTSGYDSDGLMNWLQASSWAFNLSYYDSVRGVTYTDWRLPTITDIGQDGCNFAYSGTDCGYNVNTATSEMASLYYDTLGNLALNDSSGALQAGWGLTNTSPFTNLQSGLYWSLTEYQWASPYDGAWFFRFDSGYQYYTGNKFASNFYAFAVRDGDVAASVVPLPAAVWLFGSALAGLGWLRRQQAA